MKLSADQKKIGFGLGIIAVVVIAIVVFQVVKQSQNTKQQQAAEEHLSGIRKTDPISGEAYFENSNYCGEPGCGQTERFYLGLRVLSESGLSYPKQQGFESAFTAFASKNYPDKSGIIRIKKDSYEMNISDSGQNIAKFTVYLKDDTHFIVEIDDTSIRPGVSDLIIKNSSGKIVEQIKI